MATSKFKKALYLVGLFHNDRHLTLQEIRQQFQIAFAGEEQPSRSTIIRLREFVEENFPCRIVYSIPERTYHLEMAISREERQKRMFLYIMSVYNIVDVAPLLTRHKDKVIYADIVTGTENLDIQLKVYGSERSYLRARPLHYSQEEVVSTPHDKSNEEAEYSIFRLHLIPCYNFYQQLLFHREKIQVIAPESVKQEMADIVKQLNKFYL